MLMGGCARYVHRRPVVGENGELGQEVSKVTLWFQNASAAKIATSVESERDGYKRTVGVDEAATLPDAEAVAEILRLLSRPAGP